MSRFHENDGDNPIGYLWNYMIHRSADSKKGQRVLADMRDALLAMPVRALAHSSLLTKDGATCAVGVFAKARGVDLEPYRDRVEILWEGDAGHERHASAEDTVDVGVQAGMQRMLARHFGFMNDVELEAQRFYVPKHGVYVEVIDDADPGYRLRGAFSDRAQRWDGNYDTHPLKRIERVSEYDWGHPGYSSGVTDEGRWQAVYDWVCANLRIEHPPALIAA